MVGHLPDGSTIRYGKPLEAVDQSCMRFVTPLARANRWPAGLSVSRTEHLHVSAQKSMPIITRFPEGMIAIEETGKRTTYVRVWIRHQRLLRKL